MYASAETLLPAFPQAATKTKWIHRNKGSGQLSAAASLGMLLMWDIDAGIQKIDA